MDNKNRFEDEIEILDIFDNGLSNNPKIEETSMVVDNQTKTNETTNSEVKEQTVNHSDLFSSNQQAPLGNDLNISNSMMNNELDSVMNSVETNNQSIQPKYSENLYEKSTYSTQDKVDNFEYDFDFTNQVGSIETSTPSFSEQMNSFKINSDEELEEPVVSSNATAETAINNDFFSQHAETDANNNYESSGFSDVQQTKSGLLNETVNEPQVESQVNVETGVLDNVTSPLENDKIVNNPMPEAITSSVEQNKDTKEVNDKEKKNKSGIIFIIILFALLALVVIFLPQISEFIS